MTVLLRRLRVADLALLVVAVGAGIRIWRWSLDQPLWLDEQMIAINIRDRGLGGLTGDLSFDQSAPLGWLYSQWSVAQLLGTGERSLRLIPLLFGIATLVVAWLIGRRWLGPVGTLTLVGLCAVNGSLLRYSTEVKQYSGDVFWVFVLLGLAAWVGESARPVRALVVWWATAALAGWFSMAAVLATPGLAAVLLAALWWRARRDRARLGRDTPGGRRVAVLGALAGLPWLAAFGLHYLLALRYAVGDPTLTAYWQRFGFPPRSAGPLGLARWVVRRPGSLAGDPIGVPTSFAVAFWTTAAAGMALAARRRLELGALLAAPVASAFVLAVARVVPLSGRLALWIVPALLLAVAVAAEALARGCVRLARGGLRLPAITGPGLTTTTTSTGPRAVALPRAATAAGAAAVALVALALGAVAVRPAAAQAAHRPPQAGGVDDRAAMAYLTAIRRPGDVVLVTASSWPALQWYTRPGALAPAYRARPVEPGPDCDPAGLAAAVRGQRRVLGYAGAPSSSQPRRDDVFFSRLAGLGRLAEERSFRTGPPGLATGRFVVVELSGRPAPAPAPPVPSEVAYTCLDLS